MKITNIYKKTAALFFLMAAALWPAVDAWGQAVKGNKYLMKDETFKVSTDNAVITAHHNTSEADAGSGDYKIGNAFDGNDNSWWASTQSGTINVDIDFQTNRTIRAFHFLSGGNTWEREAEIHVYSSEDGDSWTPIESFTGIDRAVREHDYCMANAVTTRYLRLQLVPGRIDFELAMNEITLYSKVDYSDKTIIHKHPKWFELRDGISTPAKNMDTFNDDIPTFGPPEDKDMVTWTGTIQAAHTYIDTIYTHPGTSVTLTLPDKLNDVSVRGYQRWYSFRTDGTYRTNNTGQDVVWDLLTPTVGTSYRFANGYVSKPIDTNANGTYQMEFYFPTSEEFRRWFNNNSSDFDGNWFVVACDVSGYNDYTETFNVTTSSESNFLETLCEPTLTHRVLYYIASVDDRTGDKWTNGHGRLSNSAYQGGGNTEGKKYLEEYEISFPFTRLSNTVVPTTGPKTTASPEQVALSKDARAYAIPKELLNGVSDTDELTVTLIDGDGSDDEKNSGIESPGF